MATLFYPSGYVPASGDVAEFYDGDTTTPAAVYENADLSSELGTSVEASSDGTWPNIYLDDETLYKVKIYRAGESTPIRTTYPINPPGEVAAGSITGTMLASGAVAASLGYTPVNKAGDTMSGNLLMAFTPTAADARDAGRAGAGQSNVQNGSYTFNLADRVKFTQKNSAGTPTWTVPPNSSVAFAIGDILPIANLATGDVTIAPGLGVLLYATGDGTSGSKTVTAYAFTNLVKVATDTWLLV